MIAPKLSELKKLSCDELIQLYYEHSVETQVGTSFLLEEIRSRSMERLASRMDKFTSGIFWMILVVTMMTIVNVVLFVVD